jgi:hypothetical protein
VKTRSGSSARRGEERPLLARQLQAPPGVAHLSPGVVDRERADALGAPAAPGVAAAQHRGQAGAQLEVAERLGYEVVATRVEGVTPRPLALLVRGYDHGQRRIDTAGDLA